jgi:hypothetical protein
MQAKEKNTESPVSEESKGMLAAILKTINQVPSLKKADRNKHGGYNYVSIDDYYKEVATIAAANGIHWHPKEIQAPELHIISMKQAQTVAAFRYSFTISHGEESVQNYFTCTIYHPFQGAQTSGSAMSYAEKLFMRTVFKVQTGEGDADASSIDTGLNDSPSDLLGDFGFTAPKAVIKAAAMPQPKKAEGEWTDEQSFALVSLVKSFIDICKDEESLTEFWVKNNPQFDKMKPHDAESYMQVLNMFKAHKAVLKGSQNV